MKSAWLLLLATICSALGQYIGIMHKLGQAYRSLSKPIIVNPFRALLNEPKEYHQAIDTDEEHEVHPSHARLLQQRTRSCDPGVLLLGFSTVDLNGLVGYVMSYQCYCPKDYRGNNCQKPIRPACTFGLADINQTVPDVSGQIVLDCFDYTGLMDVEGFKPELNSGSNVSTRALWANDSAYYDQMGNLRDPDAPLVNIDFEYLPGSGELSFTSSTFILATELISWSNSVPSKPICSQSLSIEEINGQEFIFRCTVDLEMYKEYQPYGVLTLETTVDQHDGISRQRISLKGYRWHIYNSSYVQSGTWRAVKPYSMWSKILGVAVVLTVAFFLWRQVRVWRRKAELVELIHN